MDDDGGMSRGAVRRTAGGLGTALALLAAGCRSVPPVPLDAGARARALVARSLQDPSLRDFASAVLATPLPDSGAAWDARALLATALYFAPRISLAAANARRADAAIETSRALPNPRLTLTPEYSLNPARGESPWAPGVQLAWPIAGPRKRAARLDRAQADALSARYALLAEVAATQRSVIAAQVEWLAARADEELLRAQAGAERELAGAWRARVRVGAASQAEASPALAAALGSASELAGAEARTRAAQGALAALLGVPRAALDALALAPLTAPAEPPAPAARERALAERPDALAALADYAGAEAALALEVAKQFPDLELAPGYQWDQGQNKWQLGVSLDLPLLDRNRGPIDEAIAGRAAASARFDAVQSAALVEIEAAESDFALATAQRAALRENADALDAQAERSETALREGGANRLDALTARALALRAERAARAAELRLAGARLALDAALAPPALDLDALARFEGQR